MRPGDIAPHEGMYQEHNVFGTPTGRRVTIAVGERLPSAPLGFTWTYLSDPEEHDPMQ